MVTASRWQHPVVRSLPQNAPLLGHLMHRGGQSCINSISRHGSHAGGPMKSQRTAAFAATAAITGLVLARSRQSGLRGPLLQRRALFQSTAQAVHHQSATFVSHPASSTAASSSSTKGLSTARRGKAQTKVRCYSGQSSESPVHILSACNVYRQETVILERSALAHGYTFRAVGLDKPFRGVGTKLFLYDQALKELVGEEIAPEDPVMLLDAWDTVILGPAEELREKLGSMGILDPGGSVLCAADRICAPEYKLAPKMERLYPDIRGPWKYPNSGCIAGTAGALRSFLHSLVHGPEGGGPFTEDGDDQLRMQNFVAGCEELGFRFPLVLDEDCCVVQNMGEPECGWDFELAKEGSAPRIRNWTTGHRPLVAHGCGGHGRWFLADVYRELQLLDYLGVDSAKDLSSFDYAGLVAPGDKVLDEHWVNQPPWEFPFQAFEVIRSVAIQEELRGIMGTLEQDASSD
eukprot:TRINITY_DN63609_c0_g1_i1.p1 TRINITY_DN63609_c0_g1~~TRINITY_DN63609_c0_g1_i1.p1  ORF type:complete len:462 (-),score=76.98 TRINITY_DN63609_c0_g1_i1:116-1501(-)